MIDIGIETGIPSDGIVMNITNSRAGWYEIFLGDERLYIDTVTKDGKEHFNAIAINGKVLLTEDEWKERQ